MAEFLGVSKFSGTTSTTEATGLGFTLIAGGTSAPIVLGQNALIRVAVTGVVYVRFGPTGTTSTVVNTTATPAPTDILLPIAGVYTFDTGSSSTLVFSSAGGASVSIAFLNKD